MIFMLVLIWYLIQVAALLIARFVALVLLLITSPVGIAGLAVPAISSYATQWWKALYTQALFPLVFFLMTGVSLTILSRLHPDIIAQTQGQGAQIGFLGYVITFGIAFAFLSIALRLARQLSGEAAWFKDLYGVTDKYFGKPVGQLYRLPFAAGFREYVGRGAYQAGFAWKEFAAKRRLDQTAFAPVDRQIQKILGDISQVKPFGYKGYADLHKEVEEREFELGEREKQERQKGRISGDLNEKDKAKIKRFEELSEKEKAGTLNGAEKAELQRNKSEAEQLIAYRDKGGALGILKGATDRHHKLWEAAIRRPGETDDDYRKRQSEKYIKDADGNFILDSNGKQIENIPIKEGEDLTAYFDRLDHETGAWDARGGVEAIFATLPANFIEEEYHKNPENILKYSTALNSEEFENVMKSTVVRRDIKDRMRILRHGFYADRVRELDRKVQTGELLRGSDEYENELNTLFFYADKRLKNKDEFVGLVTSTPFEDLRRRETFWKGGSTTGQYIAARDHLGTTEQYQSFELKDGQLDQQRRWGGMQIVLGREAMREGKPVNNHWLPRAGGSDKYYASTEARKWAEERAGTAQLFLDTQRKNLKLSADKFDEFVEKDDSSLGKALREARGRVYEADMVRQGSAYLLELDPQKATGQAKIELETKVNRLSAEAMKEYERIRAQSDLTAEEKRDKINKMIQTKKAENEAEGRVYEATKAIFEVQGGVTGTEGMVGWRKGKSIYELGQISKTETVYSPAYAYVVEDFQSIADIAREGNWDTRFKEAVRNSALVEKSDEVIYAFASNGNVLQSLGGWPSDAVIDQINIARREKHGLPPNEPAPGVDLPHDPREFVKQREA